MAWTTTELIASVKRRAGVPSASGAFLAADLLAIADEEMGSYVVPLILKEREDYFVAHHEEPITDALYSYPVPYRAIGGKLREVLALSPARRASDLPRVSASDLQDADFGFYLDGGMISLVSNGTNASRYGSWLRLSYYRRPNRLVDISRAAVITTVNSTTGVLTFSSLPSALSSAAVFDVVSARSPFDTLGMDVAGVVAGSQITMGAALPANVQVGDYVCLPEESPVPQVPAELHGLLAQKIAVKVLEGKQMLDKLAAARSELERMEADARALITPRVDGEAQRLVARSSLHRLQW
jgi:hypothetical protein